ncbi:MAG: response regulator [Chloroflexi bacterium]|nr:MAG: response regulator [Chloroflexota bacterium]
MTTLPNGQDKIIRNLQCGTIILDSLDQIIFMNPTAKRLLDVDGEEIVNNHQLVQILKSPLDLHRLPDQDEVVNQQVLFTIDGKQHRYHIESLPIFDNDGERNGRVLTIQDISSIQEIESQLNEARKQTDIALAKGEMAAQTKTSFFNTINHEIRTPLGAIIGMSNLLRDTPLNSEQLELVKTVIANSDDLLIIINNILEYSKIEGGEVEFDNQPFDLRDSVKISIKPFLAAAVEKSIQFHYHISEDTPNIFYGDPIRLQQILVSLLKNAIKYTDHGEIAVNISHKKLADDHVELLFSIKDTGIGISKPDLKTLFQPLSQAGNYKTRKYGGAGLGLAISKKLCELMDGSIWVESEKDAGSTFHFNITLKQSEKTPKRYLQPQSPSLRGKRLLIIAQNADHRRMISREVRTAGMSPYVAGSPSEVSYWLKRTTYDLTILDVQFLGTQNTNLIDHVNELAPKLPIILFGLPDMIKTYASDGRVSGLLPLPVVATNLYEIFINALATRKIDQKTKNQIKPNAKLNDMGKRHPLTLLMVEDNPINQKVATRLLERLGYQLDIAQNGVEGLHAIEQKSYDVILMDIQMPIMDGVETTQHIRQHVKKSQQPRIIAVTAHAMEGDREGYLEAGMDDYISKPIKLDALVSALHKCKPRVK